MEQVADRGDRAYRVVGALVVPGDDAGVEDGVGEREEQLHVGVEAAAAGAVVVAAGNVLGEQVPVAGRQDGAGSVGPVLGDHLLLVTQLGAEVEQRQCLLAVGGAAVAGRPGG